MPDAQPAVTAPDNTDFEHAFTSAVAQTSPVTPDAVPVTPVFTPTVETPAAPAVSATSAPPPSLSALALAAQKAGLTCDGLSDEQIAQSMSDHIVRTRPYATYGQQMAPYADQIREYFERGTPSGQPTTPAPVEPEEKVWDAEKYFSEKWPAPKWDDTYNFAIQNGMVQRSAETGMYEPAPGYEQMVLELLPGLNRATTWTAQQWQGITRGNPYQQFFEVLQEPLRHAWQDDVQRIVAEHFDRQQTEQRVNRFEADNAGWLYALDQQTGTQILTPKGQTFYNEIANLRERGIDDPQTLIDLASRLVGAGQSTAPLSAPTSVLPPVVPVTPQAASAQQQTTFLQNALERASHAPSAGGFSHIAPDHPVSVNENELNNMFVSALREARAG